MQYLEIVAKIHHRSAEEIYPILCDFDSYPNNSQAVHSITSQVLSDGKTVGCISLWRICHKRVKMEKLVKSPKNMR